MTRDELSQLAPRLGFSARCGSQIALHLYRRGIDTLDGMPDVPQGLRTQLAEQYAVNPLVVARHSHSTDGVDKLLVHRGDDQVVECVLLPYEKRVSCCLSTQVGCPMGCTFCATGLGGFDRNLTVGEIVGQYLLLQKLTPRRIGHIVFMGMGEPLLNLDAVIGSLRVFHDEIGISYRHMTISTVGLVPQIQRLAELDLPIHLALSLHSPFDAIRNQLMPVNHKWGVSETVGAMRAYQRATGRKVTFEYLLIDGINDTIEQATVLARMVKGFPNVVNLIPFNWVDTGHGFKRPSRQRVRAFRRELESRGVNVTERVERGHDIAAACGQLAGQHPGRFARRDHLSKLTLSP